MIKRLIYLLAFLGCFQISAQQSTATLLTDMANNWAGIYADMIDKSTTINGATLEIYSLSFNLGGTIDAYRAGGPSTYLEACMEVIDNVRLEAEPLGGGNTGYLGWPSTVSPYNDPPRNVEGTPLHELQFLKDAVQVLLTVRMDATLWANTTYQDWYNLNLSFYRTHVYEKWEQNTTQNGGENFERSRTHISSEADVVCYGFHLMTNGEDPTMLEHAQNISFDGMPSKSDGNIRDNFTDGYDAVNNRYVWNATWPNSSPEIQDTNHGFHFNTSIRYMYDMGFHFTETDLIRMANTYNDLALTNIATYEFTEFIDGTGGVQPGTDQGICAISRFNTSLMNGLENNVAANDSNDKAYAGSLAFNREIATNGRPVKPSHWIPVDGQFDFGSGTEPPEEPTLGLSLRKKKDMWFAFLN